MRDPRLAFVILGAAAFACAPATNYLDPQGPRYTGGTGVVAVDEPALRVVSFNIAYGKKYEQALPCFREPPLHGADVVLLQEMHAAAVEAMADALQVHFVYYPSSVRPG